MSSDKPKKCSKCAADRYSAICPSCGHEHKRGGARAGAGRTKLEATKAAEQIALASVGIDGRSAGSKAHALWLINQLNSVPTKEESVEVAGWRRFWDSTNAAIALECRRYLHDKAGHRAIQVINHQHDKPTESAADRSLSDRFRQALEKANKRVIEMRAGDYRIT